MRTHGQGIDFVSVFVTFFLGEKKMKLTWINLLLVGFLKCYSPRESRRRLNKNESLHHLLNFYHVLGTGLCAFRTLGGGWVMCSSCSAAQLGFQPTSLAWVLFLLSLALRLSKSCWFIGRSAVPYDSAHESLAEWSPWKSNHSWRMHRGIRAETPIPTGSAWNLLGSKMGNAKSTGLGLRNFKHFLPCHGLARDLRQVAAPCL